MYAYISVPADVAQVSDRFGTHEREEDVIVLLPLELVGGGDGARRAVAGVG